MSPPAANSNVAAFPVSSVSPMVNTDLNPFEPTSLLQMNDINNANNSNTNSINTFAKEFILKKGKGAKRKRADISSRESNHDPSDESATMAKKKRKRLPVNDNNHVKSKKKKSTKDNIKTKKVKKRKPSTNDKKSKKKKSRRLDWRRSRSWSRSRNREHTRKYDNISINRSFFEAVYDYEGDRNSSGQPHGKGKMVYDSKFGSYREYVGDWEFGKPQGAVGKMIYRGGAIYEGSWYAAKPLLNILI